MNSYLLDTWECCTSLLRRSIRYGICVWCGALGTHVGNLEVNQRKFLKLIYKKEPRYNSDWIGILDSRKLFFFNCCIVYYWKAKYLYVAPFRSKKRTQRSFNYLSLKSFNSLPEELIIFHILFPIEGNQTFVISPTSGKVLNRDRFWLFCYFWMI